MSISEELLEVASKLDYTWYSDIKRMFLAEKKYDPVSGLVKGIFTGYFEYYDDNGNHIVDDGRVDFDLKKYCWEYDFENLRDPEDKSPVEGIRVAKQIEMIIAKYTADFISPQDDVKKHNFVKSTFDVVKEKLFESGEAAKDNEFNDVLVYFVVQLKKRLHFHYGQYKEKANRINRADAFLEEIVIKVKRPAKKNKKGKVQEKVTFGFNKDSKWLKGKLSIAQVQWNLLDEDKCCMDDLVAIITAKDIAGLKSKTIYLGCYLTDFCYLLEKLRPYCSISPVKAINNAAVFYSQKGTLIKSNNLYQAKNLPTTTKNAKSIDQLFAN